MVLLQIAIHREHQLRTLLPKGTPCELGHLERRLASVQECVQDCPSGNAEDVGRDAPKLDVCGLQELLEAIALGTLALGELLSVASQLSKHPDRLRRNEALPNEP